MRVPASQAAVRSRRAGQCLTVLLAAATLIGCDDGTSELNDASLNQTLIDELPVYPGARIYEISVNPYFPEDGADAAPLGHTTNVDYRVPTGTSQRQLIAFYALRLEPEWRCGKTRLDHLLFLNCSRGDAIVGINPDNLATSPPRYELVADHEDRTS